jgi:hypothetical protein
MNSEKKLMNKMNYSKWNNESMIVYYTNGKIFLIKKPMKIFCKYLNRLQFTESCGKALLDYQNKKASLEQRSTVVCNLHSFSFYF